MLGSRNGRSGFKEIIKSGRQKLKEVAETRDGRFFLLALCVCLALLPIYFFALHLPLQQAAQEYAVKAEKARGDRAAVMNFKNVHRDMEAYQKELAEHAARSEKVLPTGLVQGEFLQELQQKALKSQVELHKVVPSERQPAAVKAAAQVLPGKEMQGQNASQEVSEEVNDLQGLQEMAVTIECEGSYFALLDFLRRLQQSERVLCIEESRLGRLQDRADGENLQCRLRVMTYAWPEEETG